MREIPYRVVHKTADYTINPANDKPGTIFGNGAATGTVIFTLPLPTKQLLGFSYDFVGIADFTITVAAPTVDTMITKNDIAADSLSAQTAGELIGARMRAECVQVALNSTTYKWVVNGVAVGYTYTVAT